jgi:hypothetical protein
VRSESAAPVWPRQDDTTSQILKCGCLCTPSTPEARPALGRRGPGTLFTEVPRR